ncbi:MAG: hypothetical protein QOH87_2605 [Trebonia sp.]|jgi:hypothetical protein|nr:hypothetical protein [Trebonia sp.]
MPGEPGSANFARPLAMAGFAIGRAPGGTGVVPPGVQLLAQLAQAGLAAMIGTEPDALLGRT